MNGCQFRVHGFKAAPQLIQLQLTLFKSTFQERHQSWGICVSTTLDCLLHVIQGLGDRAEVF